MKDLQVSRRITIPADEIQVDYARASGPGGQHVNKTETKVILRFPLLDSPSIPDTAKNRIKKKLASRLTQRGELLITCGSSRSRAKNMEEALDRLQAMLKEANHVERTRKKTRPSLGAKKRRLEAKRRTGEKKRNRSTKWSRDD